jgi:hypothetical protein
MASSTGCCSALPRAQRDEVAHGHTPLVPLRAQTGMTTTRIASRNWPGWRSSVRAALTLHNGQAKSMTWPGSAAPIVACRQVVLASLADQAQLQSSSA